MFQFQVWFYFWVGNPDKMLPFSIFFLESKIANAVLLLQKVGLWMHLLIWASKPLSTLEGRGIFGVMVGGSASGVERGRATERLIRYFVLVNCNAQAHFLSFIFQRSKIHLQIWLNKHNLILSEKEFPLRVEEVVGGLLVLVVVVLTVVEVTSSGDDVGKVVPDSKM